MKKYIPVIIISLIFFTHLIGRVNYVYDRLLAQFLYLAIINSFSVAYILYRYKLKDIVRYLGQKKIFILYFGYYLFSVLSILYADNKTESLVVLTQYSNYLISFLVIILLIKYERINFKKVFIVLTVITISLESLVILYQVFDLTIVNGKFFSRSNQFSGLAANINISAFSLTMKTPVLYYLINAKNLSSKIQKAIIFILPIVLIPIFLIQSRGAVLVITLISLISIGYNLFYHKENSTINTILLSLVFIFSFFFSNNVFNSSPYQNTTERIATLTEGTNDKSIDERVRFWRHSIDMIKENPITGIGIGNWKFKSIMYDSKNIAGYRIPYHAHNDFLQIGSEIGLFGLCLYLLFLFKTFFNSIYIGVKNKNLLMFTLALIITVYIFDSLINFPIARPISTIYLLFTISLFIYKYESQ